MRTQHFLHEQVVHENKGKEKTSYPSGFRIHCEKKKEMRISKGFRRRVGRHLIQVDIVYRIHHGKGKGKENILKGSVQRWGEDTSSEWLVVGFAPSSKMCGELRVTDVCCSTRIPNSNIRLQEISAMLTSGEVLIFESDERWFPPSFIRLNPSSLIFHMSLRVKSIISIFEESFRAPLSARSIVK
jgi:hypothetical protein